MCVIKSIVRYQLTFEPSKYGNVLKYHELGATGPSYLNGSK